MALVPPGVSNVEVIQRDDDAGQATGEPRRAHSSTRRILFRGDVTVVHTNTLGLSCL